MKTIEVRDVGPVERLEIPIPTEGGIVVLRGVNGSGKSHALAAVSALVGSGERPVSRDGTIGAYVEGLGARLTVGRRTSVSGELEVAHMDGEDPSLFVDPGIKSQDAADAERIKALLRLSRAKIDASAFANLVGGDGRLRELCRESSLEAADVPSMAAAIKRDFEAAARKSEAHAETLAAKASGVRSTVDELAGKDGGERPVVTSSADEARQRHTAAIREHAALEATLQQNAKLQRAAEEAQRAIEAMGEAGTAIVVVESERAWNGALVREQTADAKVEEIRAALSAAIAAHQETERDVANAAAEMHRQRKYAEQRASLRKVITEGEGVPEADAGDLQILAESITVAAAECNLWAVLEKTAGLRAEAERLDKQAAAAMLDGSTLRAAAQGTEGIVLDAVRAVCGDGMELRDGRLYVRTDRGAELFSELSQGERWRIALDIAVKAVGTDGLLVVRQEAYEALDPVNRREVSEHARRLGVVILTAEADDGAIRAEVA